MTTRADSAEELQDEKASGVEIAEFDALRREIEVHIAERRKIESQVIIGIAILYSWLFTREDVIPEYLFRSALAIAPILTFLGFLRWSAIHLRTMKIGEYLSKISSAQSLNNGGWEAFLKEHRRQRPLFGQFEGWTEFIVWTTLFASTLAVLTLLPAP